MKRYIFLVLLVSTFLFGGLPATLTRADAAADRGKTAPREALPEDLEDLDVKDHYIDSEAQHAGIIQTVIGHVVVLHEDSGQAFFAAAGDAVFKHDAIFTLQDSRSRIKFTTEDVITMGENARLGLEEYIDNRLKKKKTSIFNMLRGKAMFYVVRLFKYKTTSIVVKTPTAVVGVRGTKFGVEVRKEGDKIAANKPVYLADTSDAGFEYLLARTIPGGLVTVTYCFNGALDVTALADSTTQKVNANESRVATSERGENKQPTPPDVARQFESDTEAPEPSAAQDAGTGEGKKDAGTGESMVNIGGESGTTNTAVVDKAVIVVQSTTNVQIATESTSIIRQGYFSGMLKNQSGLPLVDVYLSSSRQDFNAAVIRADGLANTSGFIDGYSDGGFNNTSPKLKQASVDGTPANSSDDNLGYSVTKGELGSNTYMEWGWWYVSQTFLIDTVIHDLHNKGYYIAGYPTPDAAVAGISGTYSGPAYGTYFDTAGSEPQGIDMTGTFSCNLSSSAISNFALSVSGGNKSASITGASGTLSGSTFNITGGTVTLNDSSPDYASAQGSLYGPNGEFIGGAWGMVDGLNGAQGVFQGAKQ
ncbi:MAG: FecR family protein [Candidatus Desulfatibia sp.]|uniref:FecR domain-containing protein n=1 Tax=Candidatus Desulfatibia sp. TaxID=3101189 RepID=UPI002F30B1C6